MSRRLEIEVIGSTKDAEQALSRLSQKGRGLGTAVKAGAVVFGAALAGLGLAAKRGFGEFMESEQVMAQTVAGLKSTGGAANVTAKDITNLATSISKMSGIDDEAVQASENLLLTFTKVQNSAGAGNRIFDQASVAIADMATKMNSGAVPSMEQMNTAAIRIGKSLNDPVKGVSALTKAGVQFTQSQKDMIEKLVKGGDMMGAQKIILGELSTQFGGAAKAAGETLGGQLSKLRNRFDEFAGGVVAKAIPAITGFLGKFDEAQGASAKFGVVMDTIKSIGERAWEGLKTVFNAIDWAAVGQTLLTGLKTALEFLGSIDYGGIAKTVATKVIAAVSAAFNAIDWNKLGNDVGKYLVTALGKMTSFINSIDWNMVGQALVAGVGKAIQAIARFLAGVDWPTVLVAIGRGIAAVLRGLGGLVLGIAEALGGKIVEGLIKGVEALPGALLALVRLALQGLRQLPGLALEAARAIGKALVDGAIAGVKALPGALLGLLRLYAQGVSALGGLFLEKAQGLGRAIIDGIVAGIKAAPGAITDALGGAVQGAFDSVKSRFGIGSPSKYAEINIGKPISEGVAKGILSGELRVTEALVNVATRAVEKARGKVQSQFGKLQTWLERAFGARQAAQLTPTEVLINEAELKRQQQDLADAIATAGRELAAASTAGQEAGQALAAAQLGGDPEAIAAAQKRWDDAHAAILAAQKQFDDAKYAQWLADAQKQAAEERKDLENRQWLEQQAFQQRLAALQAYLESGQATAKGATDRIRDLMGDFGIQAGAMGELLGDQFAQGMRAMIPAVARAAAALRTAVRNEGILQRGRRITIEMKEREDRQRARRRSGGRGGPPEPDKIRGYGLPQMVNFARRVGGVVTSAYRPGDPGLHGLSRAIDIDAGGQSDNLRLFHRIHEAFGTGNISELFFDPARWYIDNARGTGPPGGGRIIRGAIGDHDDHVHWGYKLGGIMTKPWSGLASIAERRPEALIPLGTPAADRYLGTGGGGGEVHYHFNFPHYVGAKDELLREAKSAFEDAQRNGARMPWHRSAPGFS